ncbi:hypothetical protein [Alkaliphilus sp. B6464]|uniref:hypothetical protein n=1 Tax=Alkaliphilus sp. B6464 TaxID=2731219 RepID=UPI001BAA5654|nr:hypothetical protein [Alkaliphilus sp. B6464]QUH21434.1 hypothetical protein HYG84_17130 [Alkaliphilus sp. B6464]
MKLTQSYIELCTEIEGFEYRIENIKKEIENIYKLMHTGPKGITGIDYSKEPSGSVVHIPLDRLIDRLKRAENTLEVLEDTVKEKNACKEQIEGMLKKLEGVDHKILYMRFVDGKDNQKIADELGYSYSHVSNTISKHSKDVVRQDKKDVI